MPTTKTNHAIDNARGHLESIRDLMARYQGIQKHGTPPEQDEIDEEINEYPLSILVRGPWRSPGERDESAAEYAILLTTGGPALRIIGELDGGQPTNARIQWQDWGTPWTDLHGADFPVLCDAETQSALEPSAWDEILVAFASHFYFEEG